MVASCACAFFGMCACAACKEACDCCGATAKRSRTPYIITFIIGFSIAVCLGVWGGATACDIIPEYAWTGTCTELCPSCQGNASLYRFSLAFAAFHLMFFLILFVPGCGRIQHKGLIIRTTLLAGGLVACWFIPNDFFNIYSWIARIGSLLFLSAQFFLISWWSWDVSMWAQASYGKAETGVVNSCLLMFLVVFSFSGIAFSYTLLALFFGWYAPTEILGQPVDCGHNQIIIIITMVVIFLFSFLAALGWTQRGHIFQASCMAMYVTWLVYQAMNTAVDPFALAVKLAGGESGDSKPACNTVQGDVPGQMGKGTFTFYAGIAITFLTISFIGYQTQSTRMCSGLCCDGDDEEDEASASDKEAQKPTGPADDNDALPTSGRLEGWKSEKGSSGGVQDPDMELSDEKDTAANRAVNRDFHLIMFLASLYMAMLLSNWTDMSGEANYLEWNYALNIVAAGFSSLMYFTVLIAPQVCGGTDV